MSRPSNRSAHHTKKRRKVQDFAQESSVSIVRREKGRRRTKEYGVDKIAGILSNVAINPVVTEFGPSNDNLDVMEVVAEEVVVVSAKSRKTKSQNDMTNEWLTKENQYMAALLDFEHIGGVLACVYCNRASHQLFRCTTCIKVVNCCQNCIVQMHQAMPFHRIALWNHGTGCFQEKSLSELGLVINVGHKNQNELCPSTSSPRGVVTEDLQLFGSRLFSASVQVPQTAFSFAVLELFRHLHLEGKGSAYTFMNGLHHLTDDAGCGGIEDRVREFRRVFRQWNYLHARKLAGRYGDSSPSLTLAVACPACPHPGKNISRQWIEEIPVEKHWLHRQFVHFDANFKLKLEKRANRAIGSKSLWGGDGYLLRTKSIAAIWRQQTPRDERHQIVLTIGRFYKARGADLIRWKSLALQAPCVVTSVLSHKALSTFLTERGEAVHRRLIKTDGLHRRYVNADYGISSALRSMTDLKEIVLSYDIACQYSKKFIERFTASPALTLPRCALTFAVPKFHLPAHKEACRYFYSFNYLKKVGRTDGEAIERFWSRHNLLSGSTSRMNPETRLDSLNVHFENWNWKKLVEMGETLENRLGDAQEQINLHQDRFTELRLSLNREDMTRWEELEETFIPVLGQRTIYQCAREEAPTQVAILAQLSRMRDAGNARQDHIIANGDRAVAAIWINDGLELEESQRSLRVQASKIDAGSTERERVLLERRRLALYQQYRAWRERSPLEVDVEANIEPDDDDMDVEFEELELPLPSSSAENGTDLLRQVRVIEKELRIGQAYDSLKQLRKVLALRLVILRESRKVYGQRDNLRSRAAIDRVNADIDQAVLRYRAAYSALILLGFEADDQDLQVLNAQDINTANVFNEERSLGRGYETGDISWIWRMRGIGAEQRDNNWLNEVLRVQFLDAKTTLDRWREEAELCKAELLRTADYFRWTAVSWGHRAAWGQTPGEQAHGSLMNLRFLELERRVRARLP